MRVANKGTKFTKNGKANGWLPLSFIVNYQLSIAVLVGAGRARTLLPLPIRDPPAVVGKRKADTAIHHKGTKFTKNGKDNGWLPLSFIVNYQLSIAVLVGAGRARALLPLPIRDPPAVVVHYQLS